MIFKPILVAKVLASSKTMTRRRLPCRYKAGRWYKVQPGRGKMHVCHVFVTRVREERLANISYADVKAEGFMSLRSFVAYWKRINGGWNSNQRVAVIEWIMFPVVKDCCAKLEPLG